MSDSADHLVSAVTAIIIAVIGVAVIAVLVSQQADTSNVLRAGGSTFADMLACAMSPITGKPCRGGGSSSPIAIKIPLPGTNRGGTADSTITYGDVVPNVPYESGG